MPPLNAAAARGGSDTQFPGIAAPVAAGGVAGGTALAQGAAP